MLSPSDPVNQHSNNIRLVEAVIVAGLYPHVARLDMSERDGDRSRSRGGRRGRNDRPPRGRWMVRSGEVSLHPSSVLFNEKHFDSPFLVYHEKVKTGKVYVRDATVVGSYALLLFGVDFAIQHEKSIVILDDWLSFQIQPRTAVLLADLRLELRKILIEKIQCPGADMGVIDAQEAARSSLQKDEQSESRIEWRRVHASSLVPPTQPADATSGLVNSLAPGLASIKAAPDLLNVVAMLLAEEDKNRKKVKDAARQTDTSRSTNDAVTMTPRQTKQ